MKILIQDERGVRKLEEGYATEEELQTFLRDHAELIPVDEIELGTPPLLCIGWEVSVASGSEDLLYVDETGLLTIVETKLRKNPEARREVVGQVLEYGAQASAWSPNDIEAKAQKFLSSAQCPQEYRGLTLERALRHFLERTGSPAREGFSYENFLNLASGNLERGHVRLVIAIDEPPDPLLRIVEFVNRFSERFEMYLIQLKRFHDKASGQNIFVPALFGRVVRPETKRGRGRQWDRERFFQQAQEKCPEGLPVLTRLVDFADRDEAITWGRGASIGTFQFLFSVQGGRKLPAFFVGADGRMSFDFWTLKKWLDPSVVASYRDHLALAKDIPREAISTDTWKEFDVSALNSQQSWKAFQRAVLALREASSESVP
jgi:hypothetical protein